MPTHGSQATPDESRLPPTAAFGAWLKEQRQGRDLTQDALARQTGCSTEMIRKIEAGMRRPSRQIAELLAEALGIAPEERPGFLFWARGLSEAPPVAPSPPSPAPPPSAPAVTNIPALLTPLIGRAPEVAAVRRLLWRASRRLVTLTGPGGVGKTRLALQVAEETLADLTHGALFVSLAATQDPALVAATIAGALGLTETAGRPPGAALTAYFRDLAMLLVLDNFEQVGEAAPQVVDLLAGAPHLKVLVTSREPLGVRGEAVFLVPPLAVPPAQDSPSADALRESPAVTLFVERAQDSYPGLQFAPDELAVVAAICRRLDGLPLAIELAAARSRILAPPALLAHLQRAIPAPALGLLIGGYRDLPARQQTLRGAIAWSYDLLPAAEQALFRRLAVFADGCTLEAVERIGGGPPLDGLESLVSKSLLRREVAGDEARFAMLATIREYALEQVLAHGELDALRAAHAAFFLHLAETAEPHLSGPQQGRWLDRLDREQANFRAALDWLLAAGDAEGTTRVAAALGRFWQLRGYWQEGRRWLDLAHGLAGDLAPPVRARVARAAGGLALSQADFGPARGLLEEALALFQALGDELSAAQVLDRLGAAAFDQGERERGIALYEASLTLNRKLGHTGGIARALRGLGRAASQQGETARAWAYNEEALALFRECGDEMGVAQCLDNLGDVAALNQGDYGRAIIFYQEALSLFRRLGAPAQVTNTLVVLATALLEQGEPARAAAASAEALDLSRAMGNQEGIGLARGLQGRVALAQGDYRAAARWCRTSVLILRDVGHTRELADALMNLAAVAVARGQAAPATRLAGAVASLYAALGTGADRAYHTRHTQILAAARAALAPDAFAAAWEAGRALSLAAAIAYAAELPDEADDGL
jgi:predicted ATPase/DNA-binding XRE family transcriptional regulator